MASRKRNIILTILLIFAGAAAFVILKSYALTQIRYSFISRLEALKVSGFNVDYDSISIDLRTNTIFIGGLVLQKNAYDTSCIHPEFIAVSKVRASGFRLFPLIFQNALSIRNLHLDQADLVINENSHLFADAARQHKNNFSLAIDSIFINAVNLEYIDSLNCELNTSVNTHLTLASLKLDFSTDPPYAFSIDHLAMDSTEVKLPQVFYTFRIRQTRIDFSKHSMEIDSMDIIPDLGKLEFGRRMGHEIDRFQGMISFLRSYDVLFSYDDLMVFNSGKVEVSFHLNVFRDKRLPFKNNIKPLPVAALRTLPLAIDIDTLKILNSYVQYEEFGEEAKEQGGIFFDNLVATVENVGNGPATEGETRMRATASLMGQGKVQLYVTMPWDEGKKTQLAGTLQDFPMTRINPILEPIANIKVESGNMNELSFNFVYDDTRSDGEIVLNYTDLKLVTFKEGNVDKKGEKKDEGEKDNFKSFIINTFIIRRNMDKGMSEDKRTGTVLFFRDKRRSIFNYWAKSLMSGIKSAHNLEKITEKKVKQADRREKKLHRKMARKSKKAERVKDRG